MNQRETIELVARREFSRGLPLARLAGGDARSRCWSSPGSRSSPSSPPAAPASTPATWRPPGRSATAIAAKARAEAKGYGIKLEVEDATSAAVAREKVDGRRRRRGARPARPDRRQGPRRLAGGAAPDRRPHGAAAKRSCAPPASPPPQARAALEPPPLPTVEITTGEGEGGTGLAYIGALLLYVALISFGYSIASSVVTEKSSRVVEVILSAIRPVQLLAGKLIGVGILGLLQIAAVAAIGLVIAVPGGAISLPSSTFETVVLVLVYFVLGYVFYGGLFAAAASLVSRQEDTQSTTGPILIVLIASYLATNAALGNPSGGLATVGTFLPPMAPMVVPGRAAQGELPAGELIVSLLLMLAAIVVVVVVAARIYDRSVLRFGTPMKLREAVKIAVQRG